MTYEQLRKISLHILILLAAVLFFLFLSPTVFAAEDAGTCGENVTWTLNGTTLTISGNGVIEDYQEFTPAPWNKYANEICSIIVEDGVTGIGDFAFFDLPKVSAVDLADSVTVIGDYGFYGCGALQLLNLGNGLTEICRSAFEECSSLMTVKLPEGLKQIGFHGFYRCESIKSITVPSTVTIMGTTVFAYCTNLRSAQIMAQIEELPLWTFYGCYNLSDVRLASSIASVGVYAFHDCDKLPADIYARSDSKQPAEPIIDSTIVKKENGDQVITENKYLSSENSSINVETVTTHTGKETTDRVVVEALLEEKEGWGELEEEVNEALKNSDIVNEERVEVTVGLKEDSVLSGSDLARFAGKSVNLTVHTKQGAYWHIDGQNIKKETLADSYELAFTLRKIMEPTEEQKNVVGIGSSYSLVFHSDIDFKTEVELPLGEELRLATAIFFAPADKTYDRMQSVVVDEEGIAHFYLANVQAGTEYLVGINLPDKEADTTVNPAIIPQTLQDQARKYEQVEEIEYIVTGIKSSWGMDFGQVSRILAAVMLSCVIVVGVVVYLMFKRKLKMNALEGSPYSEDFYERR